MNTNLTETTTIPVRAACVVTPKRNVLSFFLCRFEGTTGSRSPRVQTLARRSLSYGDLRKSPSGVETLPD